MNESFDQSSSNNTQRDMKNLNNKWMLQLSPSLSPSQTDLVALGDNFRAAVDRALYLPRRRPLHDHLCRDPA